MTSALRCLRRILSLPPVRGFTTSARRLEIRSLAELPDRIHPAVKDTNANSLQALQWPSPPRNILLVRKDDDPAVRAAVIEYAKHIHQTYPAVSFVLEPYVAQELHNDLPFPVYASSATVDSATIPYSEKVDLTTTLGGDGTILHAASLFATASSVPPVLSFSMGTLGFLGEWNFAEHKRAFREVYVSGAPAPHSTSDPPTPTPNTPPGWQNLHGKALGPARASRLLMRNRLRIGLFSPSGTRLPYSPTTPTSSDIFALNEVLLHRGALPHLAQLTILIGAPGPGQRTLTTAIADGFLVSTPTGSTAYSLSSGGSIVHPLVQSLLLTPICPRSLSFRPLVLPANTPITLRIDEANRGKEIEVSVDGVRRGQGLGAGMEVRVVGEEVGGAGVLGGGVPSIVRRGGGEGGGEDHWVGGLNSLLKFNYPFGEEG